MDETVSFDHFFQAIVGRAGEIIGDADAAFELVPTQSVVDRAEGIATGGASVDEKATEARMKAGGVLQRACVSEQPVGPGSVGAAKQRAHHLLDHDQCGVGQRRFGLDHGGDEQGKASGAFETPQVLRGDDAGGARDERASPLLSRERTYV